MTSRTKEQEHKEAREFAIECMDAGKKVSIRLDANNNLYAVSYGGLAKHFHFTPPAPEYEAGIVGMFSDYEGDGSATYGEFLDIVAGRYRHRNGCYWDNFTPLPIYAELEQTKKALENMGKEYCEAVNSKQKGCSECPIKDRCSIHDDTNHDGLVAHFLKEARDE